MLFNLITSSTTASDGGGVETYQFLAESPNIDELTYSNVTTVAGVTEGSLINEGAGWLVFGKNLTPKLIISKKNIRNNISWNHLNLMNCVFGDKIITINNEQFKIRLLKGADTDPFTIPAGETSGFDTEGTRNSEWSRLFYPIINDDPYVSNPPQDPNAPYTNSDLMDEKISWCQETYLDDPTTRILRGGIVSSSTNILQSTVAITITGWRPCLEYV